MKIRLGFATPLAIAVLAIASPALAQPGGPVASLLRGFGIQGGFTQATLTGDATAVDRLSGFTLGLFVTPKPDTFTWQLDIGYAGKGSKVLGTGTYRAHYFELPLMMRINLLPDRQTRFHLLAGGSIGMKFRATLETAAGTQDLSDFGTRFEIAAHVGAGIDIRRLTIGVRVTQGLTRTGVLLNTNPTRNRTASVLVGWRFPW